MWLLFASYVFYGWWDWRFLGLLFISTLTDYVVAIAISRSQGTYKRRVLLLVSLVINLGILGFFKYFNFFIESFLPLLNRVGLEGDWVTLKVILPVGISFYTFQSLSYTIDVYRGKLAPCRRFETFALYVSFFPQLVAGPIERATQLLPQIQNPRKLYPQQIHAGLYLILWGYCKKMVIADNMAVIVESVFSHDSKMQGMAVVIGVLAFAMQIYGDFSGYCDIA
ncbi:MAG: hypothetical protein JKX85_00935, partial [Phycisphaeraceae bacterium]|nr:hypothetical protein [Phycisphaeraceae bacterium]